MITREHDYELDRRSTTEVAVEILRKSGRYGDIPISLVEKKIHDLRQSGVKDSQIQDILCGSIENGSLGKDDRRTRIKVFKIPADFQSDIR